ncbi:MAG TPA: hypothetical protein VM166_15400 [Gemmatimonadaceae bacterium]|nr:hypothetical protein [Gemmatimonadaceae bacterium]
MLVHVVVPREKVQLCAFELAKFGVSALTDAAPMVRMEEELGPVESAHAASTATHANEASAETNSFI